MFPTTQPRYAGRRRRLAVTAAACTGLMIAALATGGPALAAGGGHQGPGGQGIGDTTTPIKHVIVVYQENVSFDHYFGTYPHAANTDGTRFRRSTGHPDGERPQRGPVEQQPERDEPGPAHAGPGADL